MNRRGKKGEIDRDDQQDEPHKGQTNNDLISRANQLWNNVTAYLYQPVSATSLVFFRIAWGLILFIESTSYLYADAEFLRYHADLEVYFPFYGFEFVKPMSFNNLRLMTCGLVIASLMLVVGLFYKLSAIYLFFGFTYIFLLESTTYQNHIYLMCMLCLLVALMPLNQHFSLDNVLCGYFFPSSTRLSTTPSWWHQLEEPEHMIIRFFQGSANIQIPYWPIWILQSITAIVYFYATIAKVNEDWLRGEPLIHWLGKRRHYPLIGYFLGEEWVAILMSWIGLFYDGTVTVLLLWKPFRPLGFALSCVFHGLNKMIFNIAIFPYIMMAVTSLFFEPDWPSRLMHLLCDHPYRPNPPVRKRDTPSLGQKLMALFLIIIVIYNVLIPLRHFVYEGNVNWTEEGHRFSWRMKLRDKQGVVTFFVTDPGSQIRAIVDLDDYLNPSQIRKIQCHPEMIQLFAYELAERHLASKGKWPQVTAEVVCSLNWRPYQYMMRSNVDLVSFPKWYSKFLKCIYEIRSHMSEFIEPLVLLGVTEHELFVDWENYKYAPDD